MKLTLQDDMKKYKDLLAAADRAHDAGLLSYNLPNSLKDARVIAFTGKKESGKSTAVEYMKSRLPGVRVNFKDALIEEMKEKFPNLLIHFAVQHDTSINELFEKKPSEVRLLMQEFGTNVRRADDPNYWVEKWNERIEYYLENDSRIYVDDVRFLNEATAVRDAGGVVVRIVRVGQDSDDTHVSETEMDLIVPDYTIFAQNVNELHAKLGPLLISKNGNQ